MKWNENGLSDKMAKKYNKVKKRPTEKKWNKIKRNQKKWNLRMTMRII